MPIVRLSRDKRGLDTIYLVDSRPDRRSSGSRILYFWTAPPGLRVGRPALDASRQRELERAYPDVSFDWSELLRSIDAARQQAPPLNPEERRDAWRTGARAGRPAPRAMRSGHEPAKDEAPQHADGDRPQHAETTVPPSSSSEGAEAPVSRGRRRRRSRRPADGGESTRPPEPPIIDR